jgi:hypothetical protein
MCRSLWLKSDARAIGFAGRPQLCYRDREETRAADRVLGGDGLVEVSRATGEVPEVRF